LAHKIALRNIHYEEDLVDQSCLIPVKRDWPEFFLLFAPFGKEAVPETVAPKITQETLAEMTATTRARVSFFMNWFGKLEFIHYNGRLEVNSSLFNVVLND
jgi:CRP/FNR family transcriptional regulator, cyclic AMP receptor protein